MDGGWSAHGVAGLVTRCVTRLPDGRLRIAGSRRHRKGLAPRTVAPEERDTPHRTSPDAWRHLWAPGRLAWWIALLFAGGSALFCAGGFVSTWPALAPRGLVSSSTVGMVFFTGSLFFTAAAALQLLEAQNADVREIGREAAPWRWFAWRPRNAGYLASLIQLVGTILFNVNTADALITGLGWVEEDLLVWTPNVLGSACFLLSSGLAFVEATHGSWKPQLRDVSWWIVVINLLGSLAFGVSAVSAFAGPLADAWRSSVANLMTFAGAVCFLLGSYLLLPEMFDGTPRRSRAGAGSP